MFDISKASVEQIEGMMDCVFVPLILSEDTNRGEKMMENLHKLASILQITAGNERVSYSPSRSCALLYSL